jgi:hypothetical protein
MPTPSTEPDVPQPDFHQPDFHRAWAAELDRLEVDVELAEAMLASAATPAEQLVLAPWAPPAMRGPLPSDLEPRARLVLERQLAVAYLLTERLTATERHRRLTQKIRDTGEPDIPVYVDVSA